MLAVHTTAVIGHGYDPNRVVSTKLKVGVWRL